MTQSNSPIPPSSSPAPSPPPRKRKLLRRLLYTLFTLLFLALLLTFLAPTLLSTSSGNRFLLSQINARITGKVNASHLSLAWFSGQQIDDLTLADPAGQTILQTKSLRAPDITLLSLLRGSRNLGTIEITDLTATIAQNPDGTTNVTTALSPPAQSSVLSPQSSAPPSSSSSLKSLSAKLILTNANIHYSAPQMDPVTITSLNLTADLLNPDHLQLVAQSQFAQTNATGHLDANLIADHLLTSSGALDPVAATYNLTATLNALPVTALDRFLALTGLADALGPTADAQLQVIGKLEALSASLQFSTQHLFTKSTLTRTGTLDTKNLVASLLHAAQSNLDANIQLKDLPLAAADRLLTALHKSPLPFSLVASAGPTLNAQITATGNQDHLTSKLTAQGASLNANLGVDYSQNRLTAAPNSSIHFNITPELWANFIAAHFASTLAIPAGVQLDVTRLNLPLTATAIDYSKSNMTAILTAAPLAITTPDLGLVHLRGTNFQLTSDSLTTAITAKAHTVVDENTPPSAIDLTATASKLITSTGTLDSANAPIQADANLQNLPVPLVEKFLKKPGQFTPILGNVASATLSGRLASTGTNPLALTLNSQNAKASLSALIQNGLTNGTVRLDKDATASLVVTPELSKAFLEKITGWVNPSSGNNPITVIIKHDDFAATMPDLKNANLAKITATANLNMGTLNLQANDPIIGAAITGLDLLIAAGERGGKPDWINIAQSAATLIPGQTKEAPAETVTFSPTTLTLQNGIAKYDNLTMTLRNLPFIFQGDVNLTTKANNLTMTIPGTAIAERFPGIAKNFGPGKDIVIPIGGTYDKPTPKLDALALQIAKFLPSGGNDGKPGLGDVLQGLQGLKGSGNGATTGQNETQPGRQEKQKPAEQLIQGLLQGLDRTKKPPATQPAPPK